MSSFTKHSNIAPNWCKWLNLETFRFYHDDNMKWKYDEVPEWFEFDWCSIPFCIFGQKVEPDTLTSCCYHDWLCVNKEYSLIKSNYLFLIAMRIDWVKPWKRFRYYFWVSIWWWLFRFFIWKTSRLSNLIDKYMP